MSKNITLLFLSLLLLSSTTPAPADCDNYEPKFQCKDKETDFDDSLFSSFQTPPRGNSGWKESYEDLSILTGYVHTVYQKDRSKATLYFISNFNNKDPSLSYKTYYIYGDKKTTETQVDITPSETVNYSTTGMNSEIKVVNSKTNEVIAHITLDPLYFIWDNPKVNDYPQMENGTKGVIVEMFGWPFDDIAEECTFLGNAGYMGVKIFPPEEAVLTYENVEGGELNPWWYIYQPVSYKLNSRLGDNVQLKKMTEKCRKNGVRVYADIVINHMSGRSNDVNPVHRSYDESSGKCNIWYAKSSNCGKPYFTHGSQFLNNTYTNKMTVLEYPGVPYTIKDFHCDRSINDDNNGFELNYGWLFGLTDLKTESDYVRGRIGDYLTALLSIGVSGFRVDAGRNVGPEDQAAIYGKVRENLGGELPIDFLVYVQVFLGLQNEQSKLLICDPDSDYSFSVGFENAMKKLGFSEREINTIKIWPSDFPRYYPSCETETLTPERTVIGMETIDDQIPGVECRDLGDKGTVFMVEKNKERHKKFEIDIIKDDSVGFKIKLLLSSYSYRSSIGAYSFPDGYSDCNRCINARCKQSCTKSMPYSKAYDPYSRGYDTIDSNGNWVEGVYTRVNRDIDIVNAVRDWMHLDYLSEDELYGDYADKRRVKFLEQ